MDNWRRLVILRQLKDWREFQSWRQIKSEGLAFGRRKGDKSNKLGCAVVDCLFRSASGAKCGFESQLFGGCLLP